MKTIWLEKLATINYPDEYLNTDSLEQALNTGNN